MAATAWGDSTPVRRAVRWGRLAAVVAACLFGLPSAIPVTPATPTISPPMSARAAALPLAPQDTDQAALLYFRDCAACHGQRGAGTAQGPSITDAGAASVDFQLSTGRMPPASPRDERRRSEPAYGPEDLDALVRYVAGFGDGPPIPQVGPGDLGTGRVLYLANCAACHSATGTGGMLSGGRIAPSLLGATAVQVAEAVRVGPGAMPVYPESLLDAEDVNAVVAYVEALQNRRQDLDPGGLALGRIGPLHEGVVAVAAAALLFVLLARWLARREPMGGRR
ncbi:c-type cytochrome [Micromonospora sp. WMMD1082]|uniref:c-type cytochrome n=1 Tax=Micromonospora sp. WMMD1082 TaxID=3016104 RepID=UPI0024173BF9|nr:c-type cytochrome [Micromonospora sp. WMMD1082]MDG4798231.1 c-type cytochrome [Micromonospora sp. WMMD1082]